MITACPKCQHERTPKDDENTPEWQCPACGIAYIKYKPEEIQSQEERTKSKSSFMSGLTTELEDIVEATKLGFMPEEKKESSFAVGMGIASIIIGCFGLMGSLVPIFGVVGLPIAALGFLIAVIGRIAAINTTSTGMPNAGLVLCALPFVWQLLFVGALL